MSTDATYDMMRAGENIRCLDMPLEQNAERELGVTDIKKTAAVLIKSVKDLQSRVDRAEQRQRGNNDPPEYFVPINRSLGEIDCGGEQFTSANEKPRELERSLEIPEDEYFVPRNRARGEIG